MKKALVLMDNECQAEGFIPDIDYEFIANVHDEFQTSVRPDVAERVGEFAVAAIRVAGEHYGFRCPLDGEFRVGQSWAECH